MMEIDMKRSLAILALVGAGIAPAAADIPADAHPAGPHRAGGDTPVPGAGALLALQVGSV